MAYQIIDNVLDDNIFEIIQRKMIVEEKFPWYYNDSVVFSGRGDYDYNFQFTHSFYYYTPKSEYYSLLKPIVEYIAPAAITRIKANLSPRTPERIWAPTHVDFNDYPGKTAVFYINDNNGSTVLKYDDGDVEIESVANRLVVFDADTPHSGFTCTDEKVRCVINFNFVPFTDQSWDKGDLRTK